MAVKNANTTRTLGSVLVFWVEDDDISVPPTSACRSIYVTGFQATTEADDLISHFQRVENGGGDIESMKISERGAAVITFKSPEGKTDKVCLGQKSTYIFRTSMMLVY